MECLPSDVLSQVFSVAGVSILDFSVASRDVFRAFWILRQDQLQAKLLDAMQAYRRLKNAVRQSYQTLEKLPYMQQPPRYSALVGLHDAAATATVSLYKLENDASVNLRCCAYRLNLIMQRYSRSIN